MVGSNADMQIKALLAAAAGYVRKNPDVLVRAAVNAASLRFAVPLAAFRYLAAEAKGGKKMPKDIEVGSSPPALRLSATVDAMGTSLRASAAIRVDEIELGADRVRIAIRLNDVNLKVLDEDAESPVATLVRSGALDLSKPGNLVRYIPKRPPAVVEAEGDRIVVDLMKVPQLAENARVRRLLAVLTPLVGIRAVETEDDTLTVTLRATPSGLLHAVEAIRGEAQAS